MVKKARLGAPLLSLALAAGCTDDIREPKIVQLLHDEAAAPFGDGGHVVPPPVCSGECCPKAADSPECYPGGKNPSTYSGAECLAQKDNTGAPHWQLRQTMSISTAPPGNADPALAGVLLRRSELHSTACGESAGMGGFIQLVDLDRTNGVALTGFATRVVEQSDAIAQGGLCFVEDTYDDPDPDFRIADLYAPPPGWPDGLPPPAPLPWKVAPVRASRYDQDFDVSKDRVAILKRLASGGDLAAKGFTGVFFLDEARGYMHGYAPLGFVVTYDNATSYNAIPIREAEITSQINDPAHPNCSGVFGANPDFKGTCVGSTGTPAWSCPAGDCQQGAFGPTKVEGYFLTAEAEQIHIRAIKQTLCYRMPLPNAYPGWPLAANANLELRCRDDPKWNPKDPVNGIPPGDWCATTNSPATKDCHDAWKSVSYSTFQAFPIQVDKTCKAM